MLYEDRLTIATPEGVTLEVTLAGLGSRFTAVLVDMVLQWAILIPFFIALSSAGGEGGSGLAVALLAIGTFLVFLGYDVLFEVLASGRTPGKRLTGLRVVKVGGQPVTFLASAVRNLLRLVDILPGAYLVGMVAILATDRNQRLGDLAAGTVVVRERKEGRHGPPVTWKPNATSGVLLAEEVWAGWDVSGVTAEEVATLRRFLERRADLDPTARGRLAHELAARLAPKLVGPPDDLLPEALLEAVVAAKTARQT